MTSNAGTSLKGKGIGFAADGKDSAEAHAKDALNQIFKPEFLNRVDEIIVFNTLTKDNLVKIAHIMLKEIIEQCKDRGFTLEIAQDVYCYLAENGYNEKYGARPLRQLIQRKIEDELADLFLLGKITAGSVVRVELDSKGEVILK